jgi:hypothetical protein
VASAGAWFFGPTSAPGAVGADHAFFGVLLVYVGMALMLGSWIELVRTLRRRRPGRPVRDVAVVLAAWSAPLLVSAPLFSGDVYSYAAQGALVSRGVNPYDHGPLALGRGRYLSLVDLQWRHAAAPYGPLWERLSGWIVELSGGHVLAAVVGFRLVALVGVGLLAVAVPALAASVGGDRSVAVALAVLNPLVLLELVGGAHVDALMLGLLVAGCALARRGHVVAGLTLCAVAAEVKIPALLGVVVIGWWWAGVGVGGRQRLARLALALGLVASEMVAMGEGAGLGWRWVRGLSEPGAVVSWLDPATAVGLAVHRLAGAVGVTGHQALFVDGARALGLAAAAVITLRLVLRSGGQGGLPALGWSLLAFALLGPVVWPWYETWGIVFLAVEADGWVIPFLFVLSAVACYGDVPRPGLLVTGDPRLVALGWAGFAALIAVFVTSRVVPDRWLHRGGPAPGVRPPGPG